MSYFIFKGIYSDNMKIIVEKLPPVVKPPKKHNIIEIDGSDQIIIEDLGYQSYEKIIPFGLWNADIDLVYDWLHGKGRLILSDEPDKYYDAFILEPINYERALSFRKAKATFLVQPYKYALYEEETESHTVINRGNTDSLPLMTIYGSGTVKLKINDTEMCTLTINEYVTVDSLVKETYKGTVNKNRQMYGDFPKLKPGINEISFTGTVTKCITKVRSRWV